MKSATLSVIIPVRNGADFLPAALASVYAQTWVPDEVIVVDDGSTDATAVIATDAGARVYWQTQQGVAAARNTGIRHAQGDYVAMLDADDLWSSDALAQLYACLQMAPAAGLAHGLTVETLFPTDLNTPGTPLHPPYRFINLGALLFRRAVFAQVGLFDPSLHSGEDADWFLRAYAAGVPKCALDAVTLYYRRRPNSLTYQQGPVGLGVLRVAHRWRQRMAQNLGTDWDWAQALAYLGQHPRSALGQHSSTRIKA